MSIPTLKFPEMPRAFTSPELNPTEEAIINSGLLDIAWIDEREQLSGGHYHDIAVTYLRHGIRRGIKPNKYFDFNWVRNVYCVALTNPLDILATYIANGREHSWMPSSDFDSHQYLSDHEDVAKSGMEPLAHYIQFGKYEDRLVRSVTSPVLFDKFIINASGLFLEEWYKAKYPDMATATDLVQHFIVYGEQEGRVPNPYFDSEWYASRNFTGGSVGALAHYAKVGQYSGFDPSALFSVATYLKLCQNPSDARSAALSHFLKNGATWLGLPSFSIEDSNYLIALPQSKERTHAEKGEIMPYIPTYLWDYGQQSTPIATAVKQSWKQKYDIAWIIPDFGPGGGGHGNIFRMIKLLALRGWVQCIWINTKAFNRGATEAFSALLLDYNFVNCPIEYIDDDRYAFSNLVTDIVMVTDFSTVHYAAMVKSKLRTFYFVQDYEAYFHPHGSLQLLAEQTYNEDMDCVCAGPWLEEKMRGHGRWACSYDLAVDHLIYYPTTRLPGPIPRIIYYSRIGTPRRAVELGLVALTLLYEAG